MNRMTMFRLADRVIGATTQEAFLHEALGLVPPRALARIGLARRRRLGDTALVTLGVFCAGAMVGAGVALLAAPESGRDLRARVRAGAQRASAALRERAARAAPAGAERLDGQAAPVAVERPNGPLA